MSTITDDYIFNSDLVSIPFGVKSVVDEIKEALESANEIVSIPFGVKSVVDILGNIILPPDATASFQSPLG